MKTAQIWTEKISYVECPNCDTLEELGTEYWNSEGKNFCSKCNETYIMKDED